MKTKHIPPIILLMSLGIALLHLYCDLPVSPSDSKNTKASIIFKKSDLTLCETDVVDSVGKQMYLGAVLYLPSNIKSLNFKIIENNVITFDSTITSFKVDLSFDTVWIPRKFLSPGTRTLTLTPLSTPALATVSAKIIILGTAIANAAPQWSVDTLRKTVKVGTLVSLALSEICSDTDKDPITYSLIPGEIGKDTIIGTSYQFTSPEAGIFYAHINAADPNGLSDTVPVKITVDTASILTYTVTYQKSSDVTGDVPVDTKKYASGEIVSVPGNGNLARSGFTFAGWNTIENGSGIPYSLASTFVMGTADVVLYAQWNTKPTFIVTYNGNTNLSGTAPADSATYQAGATVIVKGNTGTMVKPGYTFAGWNTAADGSGTAYAEGATFGMGNANVILYARWTQKPTFTVTYNGNTNTAGTAPVDPGKYELQAIVTVKDNTEKMVKTGCTFAGWNTAADGSGTAYAVGATFAIQNDITLYARWTTSATFTVSYDGNGNTDGKVPVDANKYETAAIVTIVDNTGALVKTGSIFAGWNTAANGSGTAFAAGATFPMGITNVTLYAQWTLKPTFSVSYDGNGSISGTAPSDAIKYETAAIVIVKGNTGTLAKPGSTFAGWNTASDGSGTTYAAGVTFQMGSANVILYALWTTKPTFSVTYDGNTNTSGTVPADVNKYETGTTVTVKANTGTLAKTGSTFAGWNTASDGSGTTYAAGVTFQMGSANVILYALWTTKPTFSVTYDGNTNTSGTVPADANKYEAATTVTVLGNTGLLVKTGSSFAGWNTTANGSGTTYTAGATFPMGSANVTLYALWTLKPTFTVTYDGNGSTSGTVPADANKYEAAATVTVLGNTGLLVKTGSTFAGWNTAANGSGTSYAAGATFPMGSANVTLYAQWTLKPTFTVTYDGNGSTSGTVPSDAIKYETAATVTVKGNTGTLAKTGSTFAGWNTAANGSGTSYAAGATFPMGSTDVTLFAQWTISNIAPVITTQPLAKSVNQGASVSFLVEINADVYPAPTYIRWVKNNTDTITGATTLTLSQSSVSYTSAGNYKVVVKNSVGTAVSTNATLTVNDVTRPSLSLKGAADTTILLGSTWTDPKGTATDDKDGNISTNITLTGAPVNTNTAGRFTITYNVSDAAGNAAAAVTRTLRIEGWESVTTITKSGFRNAVMDGAENIYIASDQSVYKVSNGTAIEINTYDLAKDLCVAIGSDKSSVFAYATVTGKIQKYNGSLWTDFGTFGLNSIQPSSMFIGPGNGVYLSGGYPIFMQIISMYSDGTDGYQLGDINEGIPLAMTNGKSTTKNFCITTSRDAYTIGLNYSENVYEVVAGKYTNNGGTWAFQTLEVSDIECNDMKVVNYGSTGYIGYTKANANPTIYQSGNGTSWTKIPTSVANNPSIAGGMDIAVSPTGELHAAYVQGTNVLVKKYVNSGWVNIPNCNATASFTGTANNPFLLPGVDVCYIVYSDASRIYIKKWKKQ